MVIGRNIWGVSGVHWCTWVIHTITFIWLNGWTCIVLINDVLLFLFHFRTCTNPFRWLFRSPRVHPLGCWRLSAPISVLTISPPPRFEIYSINLLFILLFVWFNPLPSQYYYHQMICLGWVLYCHSRAAVNNVSIYLIFHQINDVISFMDQLLGG